MRIEKMYETEGCEKNRKEGVKLAKQVSALVSVMGKDKMTNYLRKKKAQSLL